MSKYTAEQVEEMSTAAAISLFPLASVMLRDYAALLRERESAKAAVTDEMVAVAMNAWNTPSKHGGTYVHGPADLANMRAALEAVAPMLASTPIPDEKLLNGCLIAMQTAQYQQASARVPESLEVAGYVDPAQVRSTQQVGGSVGIGSFSPRYGRTVPVYWDGATAPKPETEE